jgi:hypothetical protein
MAKLQYEEFRNEREKKLEARKQGMWVSIHNGKVLIKEITPFWWKNPWPDKG